MKRKRKVFSPPARTKGGPPAGARIVPDTHVTIDTTAALGRPVAVGSRVTIRGNGLYAGEMATVERLVGGVIPAALVRTESGRTRQVRTIDLEQIRRATGEPAADRGS